MVANNDSLFPPSLSPSLPLSLSICVCVCVCVCVCIYIYIYIYIYCVYMKSESVSHSVMSDSLEPVDLSLTGSYAHGILQARMLELVSTFFSRGSSRPRDRTQVSALQADSLLSEAIYIYVCVCVCVCIVCLYLYVCMHTSQNIIISTIGIRDSSLNHLIVKWINK